MIALLLQRISLIFIVSFSINDWYVHCQLTTNLTSTGQTVNLTMALTRSYTSQSTINNQTFFPSSIPNNPNTSMTTTTAISSTNSSGMILPYALLMIMNQAQQINQSIINNIQPISSFFNISNGLIPVSVLNISNGLIPTLFSNISNGFIPVLVLNISNGLIPALFSNISQGMQPISPNFNSSNTVRPLISYLNTSQVMQTISPYFNSSNTVRPVISYLNTSHGHIPIPIFNSSHGSQPIHFFNNSFNLTFQSSTRSHNLAIKSEQYLTLLVFIQFSIVFIFPIH